jgi:hypothetical protein
MGTIITKKIMSTIVTKKIKVGQELVYKYRTCPNPRSSSLRIYLANPPSDKGSVDIIDKMNSDLDFVGEGGYVEYQRTFVFNTPETYFVVQDYQDYLGNSTEVVLEKIVVEK